MAIHTEHDFDFFDRKKTPFSDKMPIAHYHDMNEIYFLEKGKTTYFIKNELYFLTEGDMIFIPGGVFHQTSNEEETERILLVFGDDFVGEEYLEFLDIIRTEKHIRISPEHLHTIRRILNMIEIETTAGQDDNMKLRKLYLRELLVMIKRHRIVHEEPQMNDMCILMQDAAKYIYANPDADLSLGALSARYAMSSCHFSRQFKVITGINLSEYINIVRITKAEKLLTTTTLSITEIAGKCGFDNSNYFALVFRKLKGISPKKYSAFVKNQKPSKQMF